MDIPSEGFDGLQQYFQPDYVQDADAADNAASMSLAEAPHLAPPQKSLKRAVEALCDGIDIFMDSPNCYPGKCRPSMVRKRPVPEVIPDEVEEAEIVTVVKERKKVRNINIIGKDLKMSEVMDGYVPIFCV